MYRDLLDGPQRIRDSRWTAMRDFKAWARVHLILGQRWSRERYADRAGIRFRPFIF
jgi:hypothetical protein